MVFSYGQLGPCMALPVIEKRLRLTPVRFTRLGIGLAALGRPGYVNLGHGSDLPADHSLEAMREHAFAVLDAAWDAGIRYFDAARSYGAGEQFLGAWLRVRHRAPESCLIGSKWGYVYTANWQVQSDQHEVKRHDLATLRQQIGESHRYLGSWLRLYQIHSATLESGVLQRSEVLDELARLRDGGLIIGLSVSGPHQAQTIEQALTLERGNSPLFASVQATWNLHERSAGEALDAAHQDGWLVIVKEALANGRLSPRGLNATSPMALLSEETGYPVDALALAAALQQPWADIVLSGAATVDQLHSNLQASAIVWQPAWNDRLKSSEESADYWKTRAALPWN